MLSLDTLSADHLAAIAAAAGALFTAVAAGAAWASARQGRRMIEIGERPMLQIQVTADPLDEMLGMTIMNTGRGVASGATYQLHAVGQATDGPVNDGFIQPGEKVYVKTSIGPVPVDAFQGDLEDLGAMVGYRDASGFAHYRTHTGKERHPRTLLRRRPEYPERVALFRTLFPHIDVDAATRAASGVIVRL